MYLGYITRTVCVVWSLAWLVPFLSVGSSVSCNAQMSAVWTIRYGVPHSSVLEPNLVVLYATTVSAIVRKRGFSAHVLSRDLQLYDHGDLSNCSTVLPRLLTCVEEVKVKEVKEMMTSSNQLRRNASKNCTYLAWCGSVRETASFRSAADWWCCRQPVDTDGNLGVMVDSDLSLKAHVHHIKSVGYTLNKVNFEIYIADRKAITWIGEPCIAVLCYLRSTTTGTLILDSPSQECSRS